MDMLVHGMLHKEQEEQQEGAGNVQRKCFSLRRAPHYIENSSSAHFPLSALLASFCGNDGK